MLVVIFQQGNRQIKEADVPNWPLMFMNRLEGKKKVLLPVYNSVLGNYNETKNKLSKAEKKSQDDLPELAILVQLKELKGTNLFKDEEIQPIQKR
ncbi:hypothetical protein Nepgr_027133 [Nepenthes gracilis]|uniref:Uncharacterized protein n=1 Tax=Nepenthes gracilis TaxID=150966 RepID=A0AAD3Y2N7_NEPGR|nr:hypothetical protein Nepgr_027133 [Nepenthes gracilis]